MGKRRSDSSRRSRSLRREKGHVVPVPRADRVPAPQSPNARKSSRSPFPPDRSREGSTTAPLDSPRPAERSYLDGTYLKHNPTWHAEDADWKAAQIAALLTKHDLAPAHVVEVGCGSGQVLRALQAQLAPETLFTGYEISTDAIALARHCEGERLRVVEGELTADAGLSDLLLFIDVIEHVEDVFGFLRQHRKRARHLVLHVPLDLSVQTVLRASPLVDQRRRVGHLHAFTRETLLALLEDVGLQVVDWRYTRGSIELPHYQVGLARWLRWPRRLLAAVDEDVAARVLGGFSMLVLAQPR
ncbi:MAG: methyltransferase domain-containing protein [Pseudomonadota bacterium]